MQQETDFILREVQRLTHFISNLISNISTMNTNDIEDGIKETDDFIRKEWKFSFKDIILMSKKDFLIKLKNTPDIHLEKLAKLLFLLIIKGRKNSNLINYDWNELTSKAIILLNNLDERSKIFSIERMQLKSTLSKFLQ